MARKKLKEVTSIHKWSDEDLKGGARLLIQRVLDGEHPGSAGITEIQLTMTLILNEAFRRAEAR